MHTPCRRCAAASGRARPPSPIVPSGGDEERTAQETVSHRLQLDAPFGLAPVELLGAEQLGEGVPLVLALVDPGLGHRHELSGAVGLLDVDETGPLEELPTREMGGDGDRAVAMSASAKARAESGCGVDGEERRAPAGAEKASGCSQHGELGSQSTQHIGVHHRIERARPERQGTGARSNRGHLAVRPFVSGTGEREAQPFERDIAEHDVTTAANRQVQPGPPPTGTEIEQPYPRLEAERGSEQVGLGHRRVPVGAPVAADHRPLDPEHDLGAILAIAVTEPLARVALLTRNQRELRPVRKERLTA